MNIDIPYNEFDYTFLIDSLRNYKYPRDKITSLLRNKRIVRIKKGIYILGEEERTGTYSKEILANLIYGPSYVSLEYALSLYGMIPERVETVTSVTTGKNREFRTPVGTFTYRYLNRIFFSPGVRNMPSGDGRSFLMASPEKALVDRIFFESGLESKGEVRDFLLDSMRIDPEALANLDSSRLWEITSLYKKRKIHMFNEIVKGLR